MTIAPSFEVFVLRSNGTFHRESVDWEAVVDHEKLYLWALELRKADPRVRVIVNNGGAWREVLPWV